MNQNDRGAHLDSSKAHGSEVAMAVDRQNKLKTLEALLVLDAKTGDHRAIARLVELRGPRLHAHAVRLSGEHDAAHDILQEAWIQIIRGLPKLKDENAFLPWALCIVSRRVAAHIKTRQKDRKLAQSLGSETMQITEPAHDQCVDINAVRSAIMELPPAQHATIALFYLENMRVADVARALDVPIGTVKTRLMKARKTLRILLEGETDGQA